MGCLQDDVKARVETAISLSEIEIEGVDRALSVVVPCCLTSPVKTWCEITDWCLYCSLVKLRLAENSITPSRAPPVGRDSSGGTNANLPVAMQPVLWRLW